MDFFDEKIINIAGKDFDELTDYEKALLWDNLVKQMLPKKLNKMKKKIASMDSNKVVKWYEKLIVNAAQQNSLRHFKKSMLVYGAADSDLRKKLDSISESVQKKYVSQ
jgi:hypothetical protein